MVTMNILQQKTAYSPFHYVVAYTIPLLQTQVM